MERNIFRYEALVRIAVVCWLTAKLLCLKVWFTARLFPLIPVVDALSIPAVLHTALFCISVVCFIILLIRPATIYAMAVLLATELISCLADQTRLRSWEYLYLFVLLAIIINRHSRSVMRTVVLFILVSTYCYSGLSKFNSSFLYTTWDHFILLTALHVPPGWVHHGIVHYSGMLIPVTELLLGAGLLLAAYQKTAAKGLIAMHIVNLILLGPWGAGYNETVWPWNIALSGFLYLLIIEGKQPPVALAGYGQMVLSRNFIFAITWGLLPALSWVGCWDKYLSSHMYAGNMPAMAICITDTSGMAALGPYMSIRDPMKLCDGQQLLEVQNWSVKELHTPPYLTEYAFEKLQRKFAARYDHGQCKYYIYYITGSVNKRQINER